MFGRIRGASSGRGGRISRLVLLTSAWAIGGCDFPTELPKWNATYRVPTEGTTLSVAQFLPANVALSTDRTAFVVALAPTTFSSTLAEMCSSCVLVSGIVAPKPAFSATLAGSIAFLVAAIIGDPGNSLRSLILLAASVPVFMLTRGRESRE